MCCLAVFYDRACNVVSGRGKRETEIDRRERSNISVGKSKSKVQIDYGVPELDDRDLLHLRGGQYD